MREILLLNQGKTENLGDKAINLSLINKIEKMGYKVISEGFAQTKNQSMEDMDINRNKNTTTQKSKIKIEMKKRTPIALIWLLKYFPKILIKYKEIVRNNNIQHVIIGGGQLIKTKSVFLYTFTTWVLLFKNQDVKIHVVGVGSDPKFNKIEKIVYKKILKYCDHIFVRDSESQKILESKFNTTSEMIPDVVFGFKDTFSIDIPESRKNLMVMIYDYQSLTKNFSYIKSKIDYYEEWFELIKSNMDEGTNVTLGYTTIGDKRETYEFAKYLKEVSTLEFKILNTDTVQKYLESLAKTKTIISGRMHGMLIGMNLNCDVIPYVVSPKIEIFKKESLDKSIKIEELNKEIEEKLQFILK